MSHYADVHHAYECPIRREGGTLQTIRAVDDGSPNWAVSRRRRLCNGLVSPNLSALTPRDDVRRKEQNPKDQAGNEPDRWRVDVEGTDGKGGGIAAFGSLPRSA